MPISRYQVAPSLQPVLLSSTYLHSIKLAARSKLYHIGTILCLSHDYPGPTLEEEECVSCCSPAMYAPEPVFSRLQRDRARSILKADVSSPIRVTSFTKSRSSLGPLTSRLRSTSSRALLSLSLLLKRILVCPLPLLVYDNSVRLHALLVYPVCYSLSGML